MAIIDPGLASDSDGEDDWVTANNSMLEWDDPAELVSSHASLNSEMRRTETENWERRLDLDMHRESILEMGASYHQVGKVTH